MTDKKGLRIMKKILTLCLFMLSFLSFTEISIASTPHSSFNTCAQAVPTADPSFCPSFKAVADCHCSENGLPEEVCGDMNALYQYMLDMFGSMESACAFQQDTDPQTCIDDWNCYRNGGTNSQGQLCSASGSACQ